ncbi:hypothetical protein F7725_003471 [Dissostichus mawsoni]|uniref:Uncharacterized protein n=1 Tax=Dissostichus mawsoni TaxID=36200 RepID=A0A7J5YBB2_DISMA|nr:hypothetical protein F7725_003471 [Dissostichus mawsoni]
MRSGAEMSSMLTSKLNQRSERGMGRRRGKEEEEEEEEEAKKGALKGGFTPNKDSTHMRPWVQKMNSTLPFDQMAVAIQSWI